jgi:DNA-directed RNA polymerase specialized sigma24 family protein
MQPSSHNAQPARRGDEDELYRRHHHTLQRSVARAVRASPQLIEDACQMAWMTLLRTQPERTAIFAWLRRVAIHESYRLFKLERRTTHFDHTTDEPAVALGLIADPEALESTCEARVALRVSRRSPRANAATSRSTSPDTPTTRSRSLPADASTPTSTRR